MTAPDTLPTPEQPVPWPVPREFTLGAGLLHLDGPLALRGPWQGEVALELGCLDLSPTAPPDVPEMVTVVAPDLPESGYRLEVTTGGVRILARDPDGARQAARTLHQLLPAQSWRAGGYRRDDWAVRHVQAADSPAFSYRGFLLDVARHFVTVPEVLGWIDLLAMHRLNHLHLHLTDDQGWRLPSERFDVADASWRAQTRVGHGSATDGPQAYDGTPHGGSYSRADIAEIVGYAATRGIEVVPEVDLPGHASALLHAVPDLGVPGAARPEVATTWGVFDHLVSPLPDALDLLAELLAEVAAMFPGDYLHIGGDEVLLGSWEASPQVREHAAQFGGIAGLRSHVTGALASSVIELGRRPMVWNEAFEGSGLSKGSGLPESTVVMAWHSQEVGWAAARAGHDVVMAPMLPTYFDYAESDDPAEPLAIGTANPSQQVAHWAPADPPGPPVAGRILGGQAQLWTEYLPDRSAREYRAFPRLSLLAANLWRGSPVGWPDPPGFAAQLDRLTASHVNFRPPTGPRPWQAGGTGRRRRHAG